MKKKRMEKDKKENFVCSNFRKGLMFVKETKNYIWFSLIVFFVIAILGYFFPIFFEKQILDLIKGLIEKTKGLGTFELIRFIFINNLGSSFFALFLGIFFGIFPIGVLVANAYVLGYVASKSVGVGGIGILWKLLPHGIFEIPAIIISIAIGLRLGMFLFVSKKRNFAEFKKLIIDAFRVFVLIVIPLLVLAAIIEGALIVLLE
ncbi:MAG: stage II sporulation protein M [Nanoarchaeota archaeon]